MPRGYNRDVGARRYHDYWKKNLTEAIRMDYFFENGEKSMAFHLA